ncbi:hypothetical protein B0H10DRAFT_1955953 [Mycena sp. CBHHK59/15]|nr:hypothetical protein B0H10DRAFT_1955953 [Mycena sp. CBHHK59/15]
MLLALRFAELLVVGASACSFVRSFSRGVTKSEREGGEMARGRKQKVKKKLIWYDQDNRGRWMAWVQIALSITTMEQSRRCLEGSATAIRLSGASWDGNNQKAAF